MENVTFIAIMASAILTAPIQAKQAKSAPKAASCVMASQAQVDKLFTDFNSSWAAKDPAAVTALFAKDAVLLATVSNQPRINHAEINDYFVGFLAKNPAATIDSSSYKMACNTAARMGTWTVTFTDKATGAKTDVKARYTFMYRPEGGTWKIDHLHSSMMPEKVS
jgi:uncharacterized protein (TIGR02246 family)